jgi:signal transduction histidine kinase
MRQLLHRPTLVLQALAMACVAICIGAAWFALRQPGLGVELQATATGIVVARNAVGIPGGARALALIGRAGQRETLRAGDLVEDPDMLPSYAQRDEFFARQQRLSTLLRDGDVRLAWESDRDSGETAVATRARALETLPPVFWFQLAVGIVCCLIAAWVYLLRPGDLATRMFLITGLMLFVSATAAAIYSTRELALPGAMFRWLSFLNHAGAMIFGCAFVALFASYPRRLVAARHLLWLPAVFLPWLAADAAGLAPDPDWGARVPTLLHMALALLFAVAQWRRSREQPLDRAALRWFVLTIMLGCSLAMLSISMAMFGIDAPISQGYAFGFFLIMYLGIALGLGKYRLFDLDEWAYRILLWLAGVAAIVGCDAALIATGLAQGASLGLSLLLCGGLYFPFRQWLWQRLVVRRGAGFEALVPQLSGIAFLATPASRAAAWDDLLKQMFDPLEIAASPAASGTAAVRDNGLVLHVPPCHGLAARALRYAARGRRLFSSHDANTAAALVDLLQNIMAARISYEQGVRQERVRIGRDLHDNIGARLLKLIHQLRGSSSADLAREAMKDLRTAIAAIDGKPVPLADALADWHAETEGRCDVAGVRLDWSQDSADCGQQLPPRAKAMLESVLRETVTNALKHAAPSRLRIDVRVGGETIRMHVENDGQVGDPADWQAGYGLRNMRGRLGECGGSLAIVPTALGVGLAIDAPLAAKP